MHRALVWSETNTAPGFDGWVYWTTAPTRSGDPYKAGRDRWVDGTTFHGRILAEVDSHAAAVAVCEADHATLSHT